MQKPATSALFSTGLKHFITELFQFQEFWRILVIVDLVGAGNEPKLQRIVVDVLVGTVQYGKPVSPFRFD